MLLCVDERIARAHIPNLNVISSIQYVPDSKQWLHLQQWIFLNEKKSTAVRHLSYSQLTRSACSFFNAVFFGMHYFVYFGTLYEFGTAHAKLCRPCDALHFCPFFRFISSFSEQRISYCLFWSLKRESNFMGFGLEFAQPNMAHHRAPDLFNFHCN